MKKWFKSVPYGTPPFAATMAVANDIKASDQLEKAMLSACSLKSDFRAFASFSCSVKSESSDFVLGVAVSNQDGRHFL